jgi:hypothetical protein
MPNEKVRPLVRIDQLFDRQYRICARSIVEILSQGGEIGRRANLKIWWRNP